MLRLYYDFGSYDLEPIELWSAVKERLRSDFSREDLIDFILDNCDDNVLFEYFEDDLTEMFEEQAKEEADNDYDDLNREYIRNKLGD